MTDLELLIQEWDNRPCKACGEGKLKVSQRDIPLTYLQVYTIMVPTSFPKCDVAVDGSWIKINDIKYHFDTTKSLVVN